MIWPFNRKPQEPPAPPTSKFIGGECHFVVGDRVVALADKEWLGAHIYKDAIYTVVSVSVAPVYRNHQYTRAAVRLAEPETHWNGDYGSVGLWPHDCFRKAATVHDFEAFKAKLLQPVDLNERMKA